jgi:hypothetical protein
LNNIPVGHRTSIYSATKRTRGHLAEHRDSKTSTGITQTGLDEQKKNAELSENIDISH